MAIQFSATKMEFELIIKIAKRSVALTAGTEIDYSMRDAIMDIEATHCNGMPLNLRDLASAPSADLAHDVFGIHRHLNRQTGELEDCFVPRFAAT